MTAPWVLDEDDALDLLAYLVTSARTQVDEAAEYANEVDSIVVPEAYVLPLFDEPQTIMYNTNLIDGVHVNGNSQSGPLYNVREWTAA